jgi:hypothetical protein
MARTILPAAAPDTGIADLTGFNGFSFNSLDHDNGTVTVDPPTSIFPITTSWFSSGGDPGGPLKLASVTTKEFGTQDVGPDGTFIPEPATFGMLGLALIGLAVATRKHVSVHRSRPLSSSNPSFRARQDSVSTGPPKTTEANSGVQI